MPLPIPFFVFLLQTLKEEWKEHKNIKDGEKLELTLIQSGVSELEAFLKDVEKITEKNNLQVQQEIEIRELIYDLLDKIELSLTETAVANTSKSWPWFRFSGTKTQKEVKELREKRMEPILKKINESAKAGINNGSTSSLGSPLTKVEIINEDWTQPPSSQEGQKCMNLHDKRFVEFPEEEAILECLMNTDVEKLDVIAITGMAGLGKTTLARKIYEHADVVAQFKLRIWVHVSEKFNSSNVFRQILDKLTIKKTHVKDENLPGEVRRILEKREGFLLVMDDVWTKEDWEEIRNVLPQNKTGKAIVTTRETIVADWASQRLLPHHLGYLDQNKSFELLQYQIFDKPDEFPEKLKDIGKKIAEKCGGVPLMILVIGGILKERRTSGNRGIIAIQNRWLEVFKNMDEIMSDKENSMSKAVELSYRRLSYDMKHCFLYTGLFPSDDEIPVSTLTQLWIAEGFVPWNERQSTEKNAYNILETLIKMNLVMVSKNNLEQVKKCRVHYMMREFCRDKAKSENLFRVIETKFDTRSLNNSVKFRRISFDVDSSGLLFKDLQTACVRSFLSFSKKSVTSDAIQMSTVLNVSKVLRVLNCRSIRFKEFPKVKNLMLLKHIALFIEKVDYLPEEISQLVNLQTLLVHTHSGSIEVKANIWRMVRLTCLKTKAAIVLSKEIRKSNYCGKLLTISRMPPDSCNTDLSEKAPFLKTLGVRGKLADVKTMDLKVFTYLEKLKLVNELSDESDSDCPKVLTKHNWFPPNLKSLTLSNTNLTWRMHMSILAKIESLTILKLKDNAFIGPIWDPNHREYTINDGVGFPNLQFLLMYKLELALWEAVPDNHFPNLRSLVIKECKVLEKIPENLPKSLENLETKEGNSKLDASAVEVAQRQIELNTIVNQVPVSVTINEISAASSSG